MRLSIAISALCAIPGLALTIAPQSENPGVTRPQIHDHGHENSYSPGGIPQLSNEPGNKPPPRPFYQHRVQKANKANKGHKHHKHPQPPSEGHVLTDVVVINKLNELAEKADDIATYIKGIKCNAPDECWKVVKNALYKLEIELDVFDIAIDGSNLNKCFTCTQESRIACAYRTYADSLIRLLNLVKDKTTHLPGEVDKYVLTAVNSLRGADSAFVHELGRRFYCAEELEVIMAKHGAVDGTTKGSVNEAFSKFIFTPLITGEHFKNHGHGKA